MLTFCAFCCNSCDTLTCQAVMKFHGVGNPSKTPAEATALEMGRGPQQQHFRVCFGDKFNDISHEACS